MKHILIIILALIVIAVFLPNTVISTFENGAENAIFSALLTVAAIVVITQSISSKFEGVSHE